MSKVTMKEKKERLAEILEANVGNELTAELAEEIKGIFTAQRQAASNKVDENGNIFCTYFQEYLPADEFTVGKNGKIPSMSDAGKALHRKQKSAVNKAINEVMTQFRAGEITAEDMVKLLDDIDANAKFKFPRGTEELPENYPYEV
jgi:hypothetical protein